MPRNKKGKAGAIDRHVGQRLRILRLSQKISQEQLGREIGVSFQQIQKYENGSNRISAGRLYELAQLLEVSVLDFYQGLE